MLHWHAEEIVGSLAVMIGMVVVIVTSWKRLVEFSKGGNRSQNLLLLASLLVKWMIGSIGTGCLIGLLCDPPRVGQAAFIWGLAGFLMGCCHWQYVRTQDEELKLKLPGGLMYLSQPAIVIIGLGLFLAAFITTLVPIRDNNERPVLGFCMVLTSVMLTYAIAALINRWNGD